MVCKDCMGSGNYLELDGLYEMCPSCSGTGHVKKTDSVLEKMKRFFSKYYSLVSNIKKLQKTNVELGEYIQQMIENEEHRILLHSIGLASPVMMWAKDKDGRYTYANKALADHLFYGEPKDLLGKDDAEIGAIVGKMYPKWTFGSICMGTDGITLKNNKPMKFYEWGIIRDKFQYVVAYKNTYKDQNGKVLGTVGLAYYVTDEVSDIIRIADNTRDYETKFALMKLLRKYGFGCDNQFGEDNISTVIYNQGKEL